MISSSAGFLTGACPSPTGPQQSFSEIRMIVTASLTKEAYDDLLAALGVV
jgi:hypothetical protein